MKKYSIYLPVDLIEKIKKLAKKQNLKPAQYIRVELFKLINKKNAFKE